MKSEWRDCTIGELCDNGEIDLQTGPFGSQLHAYDYAPDGVPVVPTEAIRDRSIDHSALPRISAEKANELARHKLTEGDILFARRGAQATGKTAYVRAAENGFLCGTGAIRLRLIKKHDVFSEFLSHVLADSNSIEWFKFHAIGATMPNLNEGIIRLFPLRLPPYEEQQAIAGILSALDDKIESNRRMNETLEAMARAIFKSWFVDFDPVSAKAEGRQPFGMDAETAACFPDSFEDSPLGKIPKGWHVLPLNETFEINPPRLLGKGQRTTYLDMQNMPTKGHRPHAWIERAFVSGSRFMNGDTLVARITPCLENGKTAYVDFLRNGEVAWGSTEFIVFRPKGPLPPEFGYCLARDEAFRDFAIQNMTGSSGRQRVPTDCFDGYGIVVPTESIATAFQVAVCPLFEKVAANAGETFTLARIRETLLPKLISGEIRV